MPQWTMRYGQQSPGSESMEHMEQSALIDAAAVARSIAESLDSPDLAARTDWITRKVREERFFLVLVGETSTGKSTFINSLLGRRLLYTAPSATTDHIAEVRTDATIDGVDVDVQLRDGGNETMSAEEYLKACETRPGSMDLAVITVDAIPDLPGFVLVDTPGFNSVLERHTEVLHSFLPNADAAVFVFNFGKMMNPTDHAYITLVRDTIGLDNVFFAVNRKKGRGRDTRTPKTLAMLQEEFGYPDHRGVYEIEARRREDGVELMCPALLEEVRSSIDEKQREAIVLNNGTALLEDTIRDLQMEYLQILRSVADTQDENEHEIATMRALGKDYAIDVQDARDTFERRFGQLAPAFVDGLLAEVEGELQGGYTDREAIRLRIQETVIPNRFEAFNLDVQDCLTEVMEELERKVDTRNRKAIALIYERKMSLPPGVSKGTRVGLRRIGGRVVTKGMLDYFARFGGVAGHKGGMTNLAKHLLSRAGNLVNKTFPKAVYDNMHRTLTRIGLTSTRVAGALAAVAMELVIIVIDFTTWRVRARHKAKKTTEDHVATLRDGVHEEVDELFDSTLKLLQRPLDKLIQKKEMAMAGRFGTEKIAEIGTQFERLGSYNPAWKEWGDD
jgi:GTPase Era involved in 16S rRNA processing